jgi:hypothetical protein
VLFATTAVPQGQIRVRQGVARLLAGWSALSSTFCKFLVRVSGSTWMHPLAPLWIRARHWNRNVQHRHWTKNHTKRDTLIQWLRLQLHVRWTGIQSATALYCRDDAVTVIAHTFQWLQTVQLTAERAWGNLRGTATRVIAYTETVSDRVSRGASVARRATLPQTTTAAFFLSVSLANI